MGNRDRWQKRIKEIRIVRRLLDDIYIYIYIYIYINGILFYYRGISNLYLVISSLLCLMANQILFICKRNSVSMTLHQTSDDILLHFRVQSIKKTFVNSRQSNRLASNPIPLVNQKSINIKIKFFGY